MNNKVQYSYRLGFLLCSLVFLFSCGHRHRAELSVPIIDPAIEKNFALQQKYASLLGVDVIQVSNTPLYSFLDEWTGTPYLYGGKNKEGIDCSGFTHILYATVYAKELNGSSRDLFTKCVPVEKQDLMEGDLVFFRIETDQISHVGVYLINGKFAHASTKKGVMISDLSEAYYTRYFYKGGRPENK
ncbi:MAG: C40 family peptidase [Bacteroidia bacterium]